MRLNRFSLLHSLNCGEYAIVTSETEISAMIAQLLIGSLVISLTVIVEAAFMGVAEHVLMKNGKWMMREPHRIRQVIALIGVTLWLIAAISVAVWLWAVTYLAVGSFDAMEPALYFSIVTFTTLGFGDVLLTEQWRLLSGLAAANGLLIFGLSTAFMVEFLGRVRKAQANNHEDA